MKWGKKDKHANQNQAWLDWLNDDAVVRPDAPQSPPAHKSSFSSQPAKFGGMDGFARPLSGPQPTFTPQRPIVPSPSKPVSTKPRSVKPSQLDWRLPSRTPNTSKPNDGNKDIAINIHLPQFHLPKLRLKWSYMRWVVASVVVLGLLFGGNVWLQRKNEANKLAKQTGTAQPTYAPLKPADANEQTLSASTKYDPKQQLYKYNDTFMDAPLTVSQQPLPDNLKSDPGQLAKIAEQSIQATESFDTSNGKAYIVSDDTGYTRLVLIHRQLLVFITSPKQLEIVDWVKYIQSLE